MLGGLTLLSTLPLAGLLRPVLVRDTYPVCVFRIVTGEPCPFCGLTRAFGHAAHASWSAAWQANPLWPVAAAVVLTFAVLIFIDGWTGSRRTDGVLRRLHRLRWPIALSLVAFGIYRLAG